MYPLRTAHNIILLYITIAIHETTVTNEYRITLKIRIYQKRNRGTLAQSRRIDECSGGGGGGGGFFIFSTSIVPPLPSRHCAPPSPRNSSIHSALTGISILYRNLIHSQSVVKPHRLLFYFITFSIVFNTFFTINNSIEIKKKICMYTNNIRNVTPPDPPPRRADNNQPKKKKTGNTETCVVKVIIATRLKLYN